VYGSTWLTSGLDSVIVLECEPGGPTAELRHLKQPAETIMRKLNKLVDQGLAKPVGPS
jgi:hypothetical protein